MSRLNQLEIGLVGWIEYDDVPPPYRRIAWDVDPSTRNPGPDRCSIRQEEVSHEQRVFHGSGGDDESLEEKSPDQDEEHGGDGQGLDPLDEGVFLGRGLGRLGSLRGLGRLGRGGLGS